VHQAKNREFDTVVVIWPYTVAQDDEGKRRLLYNAITRAKKQCTVIVQGVGSTGKPPFR
jgi:superfamily I DNA/RNA helicase